MRDHSPRGLPPRTIVAAVASLILILAACSSSSPSEAPGSQGAASQPAASQPTSVALTGLAFSVSEITVPVGSLTFINGDGVPHILAEGEDGTEVSQPRVQKVSINGGSEGDLVFTVAGDYHITCTVHPQMNMEVHVQ